MASWSFLTTHARVLIIISQRPESTGLEIAQALGITERAVRANIADLLESGYVEAERVGRHNRYRVDLHRPLDRLGERQLPLAALIALWPSEADRDSTTE